MSNKLQFKKVTSLPANLESNTIYLLVDDNHLSIHLSNSDGSVAYRNIKSTDVVPETTSIVNTVDELPSPSVVLKPALFALNGTGATPVWYDGIQYVDLYKTGKTTESLSGDIVLKDALEFNINLM